MVFCDAINTEHERIYIYIYIIYIYILYIYTYITSYHISIYHIKSYLYIYIIPIYIYIIRMYIYVCVCVIYVYIYIIYTSKILVQRPTEINFSTASAKAAANSYSSPSKRTWKMSPAFKATGRQGSGDFW